MTICHNDHVWNVYFFNFSVKNGYKTVCKLVVCFLNDGSSVAFFFSIDYL